MEYEDMNNIGEYSGQGSTIQQNGMVDGIPNGNPNGVQNVIPNGIPNGNPNGVQNVIPNGVPNGNPNGVQNVIPNGIPNGNPNGMTNGMANGMPIGVGMQQNGPYTNYQHFPMFFTNGHTLPTGGAQIQHYMPQNLYSSNDFTTAPTQSRPPVPIVNENSAQFRARVIDTITKGIDPLLTGRTILGSSVPNLEKDAIVQEIIDEFCTNSMPVKFTCTSRKEFSNDEECLQIGSQFEISFLIAKTNSLSKPRSNLRPIIEFACKPSKKFVQKSYLIPSHAPPPFNNGGSINMTEFKFPNASKDLLTKIYNVQGFCLKKLTTPQQAIRLFTCRESGEFVTPSLDFNWDQKNPPNAFFFSLPLSIVKLLQKIILDYLGLGLPMYNKDLSEEERVQLDEYVSLADTPEDRKKCYSVLSSERDYIVQEILHDRLMEALYNVRRYTFRNGAWMRWDSIKASGPSRSKRPKLEVPAAQDALPLPSPNSADVSIE